MILTEIICSTTESLMDIGYTQPLLKFNSLKWDKKIEPLKFNESKQAFIESQEKIAITVTEYFFDLLLAQVNLVLPKRTLVIPSVF
jgi:hypothetical protein